TAAGTGNFGPFVVAAPWVVGLSFLVGSNVFTVINPAAGPQAMQVSGINATPLATGTFDITTGTVTITGNGENTNQPVFFLTNTPGAANTTIYVNRCRFTQNGSP